MRAGKYVSIALNDTYKSKAHVSVRVGKRHETSRFQPARTRRWSEPHPRDTVTRANVERGIANSAFEVDRTKHHYQEFPTDLQSGQRSAQICGRSTTVHHLLDLELSLGSQSRRNRAG